VLGTDKDMDYEVTFIVFWPFCVPILCDILFECTGCGGKVGSGKWM